MPAKKRKPLSKRVVVGGLGRSAGKRASVWVGGREFSGNVVEFSDDETLAYFKFENGELFVPWASIQGVWIGNEVEGSGDVVVIAAHEPGIEDGM